MSLSASVCVCCVCVCVCHPSPRKSHVAHDICLYLETPLQIQDWFRALQSLENFLLSLLCPYLLHYWYRTQKSNTCWLDILGYSHIKAVNGISNETAGTKIWKQCKDPSTDEWIKMIYMPHLSHIRFFVTPWTIACQARLSMTFSR